MPVQHKAQQGLLYERAAQFADDLDHQVSSAADEMLAAWSTSYWQTRQEMDALFAKIAQAKAAGEVPSPAWAYQQQRLKAVLNQAKVSMAQYAEFASGVMTQQQASAVGAGLKHAEALAQHAIAQDLPDLAHSFARVNPAVLQSGVGFLTNGSPLRDLLVNTLPAQTAQDLQDTLLRGLAAGWGQDKMLREVTHAYGLGHGRAVTILRTESLRAYRHAARSTYMANQDALGGWVWTAHLDARTCIACALMDGTVHPIDATLDGHPRCRCAMIPRTKSWEDLGVKGQPDTRPPIRSGKAWLEAQPPHVQRAMMGRAKFDAWADGTITLDDMVGRTYHPAWGTTRTERSLKAILEGRNENYMDVAAPAAPKPPVSPKPDPAAVKDLADEHTLRDLQKWAANPEGTGPQGLANLHAAIAYKTNRLNITRPTLPEPDPAKVQALVAKMNDAVQAKGYPSKGYSQVVAIYKAQANGIPGKQVGVVKSLTWEQKITAQHALAQHDAALPGLVRAHQKQQAILKAWDEALEQDAAITKAKAEAAEKATQEAADQAAKDAEKVWEQQAGSYAIGHPAGKHHDLFWADAVKQVAEVNQDLAKAVPGSPEWKIAQAKHAVVHAKVQEYEDARAVLLKDYAGTSWVPANGTKGTFDVTPDGWGHLGGDFDLTIHPAAALKAIQKPDSWVQVVKPDPSSVKHLLQAYAPSGKMDAKTLQQMKDDLAADPWVPDQLKADMEDAILQAETVMEWAPEPEYVTKIIGELDAGNLNEQMAQDLIDLPATKPATKANLIEGLAQWKAQQVAKAAIPKVKPVIDPAKFDFAQASQKAVDAWKAKVQSGSLSLDDLYAKFQASKNKGHKTNVAKAILDLEGKPTAPTNPFGTPDQKDVDLLVTYLDGGQIKPKALEDNLTGGLSDQVKANYWQALENWKAKQTPAPKPAPTVASQGDPWPANPPWKPEDLADTGKRLGTHGAQVWKAPDGTRWLFKPPKDPKDGFLATLDEAASRLQALAGQKAPDTYVVTLGGKRGSIQRMFDASDGFPGGFRPGDLSEHDLDLVQREHVLDWLLSNHDGHRDQFLRLPDGTLTAIDKGQAFRWFGQDRLDWDFHPNSAYGAPEPVYNALWRDFAQGGKTEVDLARLQAAVKDVQAISDADLRRLLRPYAEQAAHRGLLAKRQSFPGLKAGSIPENDVDAFLDAVVARKNALAKDFQDLYDRAAKARAANLPGWKAKPTSGPGKWFGVDAPKPPAPPKSPEAALAPKFDGWLADVKAKYHAFSGKDLEASNNWARVRRVIDDLDETAVQELADRHYLDDALVQQARALIAQAKTEKQALEAAHKKALADHADLMKRYKADLQDWKDANGIVDLVAGMDDDVVRHSANHLGEKWAGKHFDEQRYTATQRKWLRSYTGSAYDSWNTHLRNTKGKPTQYLDAVKQVDKAMEAQPIPEDVILHRGTNLVTLADGTAFSGGQDLTGMVGNVLVDHGYMSTSVGNEAAFSSMAIQLKIRAKAGTPGSYVQMFSSFGHERELILGRGTHLYVHNAYKQGHKWIVEAEVVDADFDPTTVTPRPSTTPWST